MKRLRAYVVSLICSAAFLFDVPVPGQSSPSGEVVIAQLSDTHLGEKHSPHAADQLREVVEMINARHPDAVVVSGDIGETVEKREEVKTILKALSAPVYFVPGNHDVTNTNNLARYRKQFGPDYYRFQVKNVEVLALDSELLGNYEKFGPDALPPLSPEMEAESQKMLTWLDEQAGPTKSKITVAVQHIPLFRDKDFPDAKPYWIVNAPYAQRETELLHKLGIKHLLAGHWHIGRVFEQNGFTIHVAPATSWLPLGGQLGFAVHTVTADGNVRTEFVPLPKASK